MNAWDHLPNAKHIDRVLDSLKRNPEAWENTLDEALDEAWEKAFDSAWYAARDAARDAARAAAWYAAKNAARDAILSLIAYDDIAHMLYSTPDELRVLIVLGDDRAILMLPAAVVFNEEKIK